MQSILIDASLRKSSFIIRRTIGLGKCFKHILKVREITSLRNQYLRMKNISTSDLDYKTSAVASKTNQEEAAATSLYLALEKYASQSNVCFVIRCEIWNFA